MSDTKKQGKRWRKVKLRESCLLWAVSDRHTYGSTEKILRRNRKLWTRLGNKRRRRTDLVEIDEGVY